MKTWQEPPAATQPGRIVRLLRRPEGATFREIADKLKVKSNNARTYLSTLKSHGCPVQEREEEGRGRVFYLIKVDRRRKAVQELDLDAEPSLGPLLAVRKHFRDLGIPYTQAGVQDYALAAFQVAQENPSIRAAIQARLPKL